MPKAHSTSIPDPRPPKIRRRVPTWILVAAGLTLAPFLYELLGSIVASWRELLGAGNGEAQTPLWDRTRESFADSLAYLRAATADLSGDPSWDPARVVLLSLVLAITGAVLLLRSRAQR